MQAKVCVLDFFFFCFIFNQLSLEFNVLFSECLMCIVDESDDEEDRPARKRRLAERAVEGEAAEDEEVIDTVLFLPSSYYHSWFLLFSSHNSHRFKQKTTRMCRIIVF